MKFHQVFLVKEVVFEIPFSGGVIIIYDNYFSAVNEMS